MIKEAAKVAVVLASSAVAIPYTVAFLANLLKGWPLGRDKYKRAFHPRKVYALNYALLQQLGNLKYTWLYFKWRSHYANCTSTRILKDVPFGTNENALDLYFPKSRKEDEEEQLLPIVVFVYGGSWSSGDKNMYSLLCSRVADQLQAIVCCPNYSTYPRGRIHEMVQDVVDCLGWLHANIHTYRGDKERIMLIGHSAGAHLCMMAALELTLKRLLHSPESLVMPEGFIPETPQLHALGESIRFHDRYFNGGNGGSNDEGSETITPPVIISGTSTPPVLPLKSGPSTPPTQRRAHDSGANSGSFYLVEDSNNDKDQGSLEANPEAFYLIHKEIESQEKAEGAGDVPQQDVADSKATSEEKPEAEGDGAQKKTELGAGDAGTQADAAAGSVSTAASAQGPELVIEDEDLLTPSQKDIRDVLNSIKHVVGLAGVYDIGDHYEFESWRGIEDISAMARAADGPENFDRLSPTHVVSNLPDRTRLPPMTLIHGDTDRTVPPSSSRKYAELCNQMSNPVNECLLRGCGHTDVCLDLMDPNRDFYDVLMGLIDQIAQLYL